MIRALHTGDLHLTEGARFGDTRGCLHALVEDGREQGVQLWQVGGDLSGTTVPHRATILEQNTLDALFQRMAETAPVVILYGNHDSEHDLDGYARLAGPHPIYVVAEPQIIDVAGARLFALPYPHKRFWTAAGADVGSEEKDREAEGGLRGLLASWGASVREAAAQGVPTIFLGHVTIGGCAIAGGEVMPPGREIEVSVGDLQTLGCDYSGGSHIHLCQEMAPGIWYAGSPNRSNFGETDEKGWLVVDVVPGRNPIVHRRLAPARKFITKALVWTPDGARTPEGNAPTFDDVDGAEVRLSLTIPEDLAATVDREALKDVVRAAGAVDVKLDPRLEPKVRIRSAAVIDAQTISDQLAAWFDTMGETGPDAAQRARCLEKLAGLEQEVPA